MVPHSWYLERGGWTSFLKSGYLHVLATNPKRYQEIKMHLCMMHGNCERYLSSWTLGCPLVWSYFILFLCHYWCEEIWNKITIEYYWILLSLLSLLNVQSKLTMESPHQLPSIISAWKSMGFPWLFPSIFHGRGLEPRFSQDVYRGPFWSKNPRWIHGESTVNRRANLDAYDYICIQIYVSYCIYMSFICLFILGYRLFDNMFWMSQTGPLLFFCFCLSIHMTRRGIWRYRGICRVSAAPCSAPIASGQARLGWAWAIGLW